MKLVALHRLPLLLKYFLHIGRLILEKHMAQPRTIVERSALGRVRLSVGRPTGFGRGGSSMASFSRGNLLSTVERSSKVVLAVKSRS